MSVGLAAPQATFFVCSCTSEHAWKCVRVCLRIRCMCTFVCVHVCLLSRDSSSCARVACMRALVHAWIQIKKPAHPALTFLICTSQSIALHRYAISSPHRHEYPQSKERHCEDSQNKKQNVHQVFTTNTLMFSYWLCVLDFLAVWSTPTWNDGLTKIWWPEEEEMKRKHWKSTKMKSTNRLIAELLQQTSWKLTNSMWTNAAKIWLPNQINTRF